MRHKKKFNHLGRTAAHRKAMLKNMATSLIMHKRIRTTVAKAKELRMFVEPIINRAKEDTTHSRRMVFRKLQSKEAVNELFREIAVKIADRPGGYTRILKTGNRLGDNAEMCIIELVDYNEALLASKETKKSKTTRRRRGGKKTSQAAAEAPKAATTEETKAVEEKQEEPKAEAKTEETPKTEEAPKAEAKEEKAPKTEEAPKVEEPAEEPVEEAPKAEQTEATEAPKEEKAPEEEDKKEDK